MGTRHPKFFVFLLLGLILRSASSVAEKPPIESLQHHIRNLNAQENQMPFSSPVFSTQLDATPSTIPIVNPTTPTTTTPIVNPGTAPQPPTMTTPTTNPGTAPQPPTMTTPTTNPTPTPTTTTPTPTSGGSWCIASQSASQTALQVALDYACGYGGADCSAIQSGGSCYNPNTIHDHASYAFNDYYQKHPGPTSCVFGGTAQLTSTDPSSGNCHYAPPSTSQASPTQASPTPPSPNASFNPTPMTPTGPTIFGLEPTGTPNSATTISCTSLLLLTATSLLALPVAANYI